MSGLTTKVMLEKYEQDRDPTMFLTGMFQAPRGNFHNSEEVEIDIVRSEEDVAIVIQDLSLGGRYNSADVYTNKSFKPPIFKEVAAINAHTLMQRMPGQNPFESPNFLANAIARGISVSQKIQRKITRSIEWQAAQVLTTGIVTLVDASGTALYTIDYKPKAAHFPTAAVAWSGAGDPLGDLNSLANVIRGNGLVDVDMAIMGEGAFNNFIGTTAVQAQFDNRRLNMGGIVPMNRMGMGGIFRGTVEVGNYNLDIFTYPGRYKHPQTGLSTKFIPDDLVIVKSSTGRLDATFGAIPRIVGPDPRVPSALTQRINVPGVPADLQLNAWITPNGETMEVQAGSRPLLIPTAIDTFGCLDTQP